MSINKVMIEITNFEIVSSEYLNNKLFYFPEEKPFNLNFQECGVESQFFLQTMGLPLYIMHFYIALVIIYLLFRLICLKKCAKFIGATLFWNGLIRLYM